MLPQPIVKVEFELPALLDNGEQCSWFGRRRRSKRSVVSDVGAFRICPARVGTRQGEKQILIK